MTDDVGACGATLDAFGDVHLWCHLPAGHAGWHAARQAGTTDAHWQPVDEAPPTWEQRNRRDPYEPTGW